MNTDVLDRLRSVRPDPAVLFSSEVHDSVLGRIVEPVTGGEMGMPVAPVAGERTRRRRVTVIGGAVLAAAAVATVAVVTAELRGTATSTSEPAQQAIVQQLADAARQSGGAALQPGQYWYVVSQTKQQGDIGGLATSRTTTVPIRGTRSGKGETWTASNGSGWARTTTNGSPHPTVTRLHALTASMVSPMSPTPAYVAGLSTDPATLLRYLRSQAVVNPRNPTRDDDVYQQIAALLTIGYTSGDLRAALIVDLARLRDVTVSRNATDTLGRAAVAFDLDVESGAGTLRRALLFDATSGRFLQVSQTAPSVTATITVVSSSIVDQVPADVTR